MFARGDQDGMRGLYWQTAIWMAVFSLPVFLLTGPLAEPVHLVVIQPPVACRQRTEEPGRRTSRSATRSRSIGNSALS